MVIRLVITFCIFLLAAGLGLLIAALVLPGVSINAASFLLDVAIFAVLRSVISPFVIKVTMRNARALVGAAGLIATVVALVLTTIISDGLTINGAQTWVLATLIIWLVSMLAAFLIPFLILKGLLGGWLRRSFRPPGSAAKDTVSHLI